MNFLYRQQKEFTLSEAWQTWFIGGNGTGKTLTVYLNAVLQLIGTHPKQLGPPPIKIRALVPSFDNVEDVALEKLLEPQRILFPEDGLKPKHEKLIAFLEKNKALRDRGDNFIEVGPMLPRSMMVKKRSYSKDHRGIELDNGSGITNYFVRMVSTNQKYHNNMR